MSLIRPSVQEEWDKMRPLIERLYWEEDKCLTDVMVIMKNEHGFSATTKQYKTRFELWNLKKNVSTREMKAMVRIMRKREVEGKDTRFTIRQRPVAEHKLQRFQKRKADLAANRGSPDSGGTPSELAYSTPSPPKGRSAEDLTSTSEVPRRRQPPDSPTLPEHRLTLAQDTEVTGFGSLFDVAVLDSPTLGLAVPGGGQDGDVLAELDDISMDFDWELDTTHNNSSPRARDNPRTAPSGVIDYLLSQADMFGPPWTDNQTSEEQLEPLIDLEIPSTTDPHELALPFGLPITVSSGFHWEDDFYTEFLELPSDEVGGVEGECKPKEITSGKQAPPAVERSEEEKSDSRKMEVALKTSVIAIDGEGTLNPEATPPTVGGNRCKRRVRASRTASGKSRAAKHHTDDWTEVTDAEERRRIQNRIAQRKFREKAREPKEKWSPASWNPEHAGRSYRVPDPGEIEADADISGLPWGGPNLRYVISKGHESERTSFRGSASSVGSDHRGFYSPFSSSHGGPSSYDGANSSGAEEPLSASSSYYYDYGAEVEHI